MINNDDQLVLRLSPYHCCLNPIEMIWGMIKTYLVAENRTFKLADMKILADERSRHQIVSSETVSKNMFSKLKNVTGLQMVLT